MHRHRRVRLGRFGEAKACLKCGRLWWNPEECHKSRIMALAGDVIGKPHPMFNDHELQIIKSLTTPGA